MKVDGTSAGTALIGATSPVAARSKGAATASPKQDSVSLSDASSQLQALESSVNQASAFDTTKVAAIRQAIDAGRFQVDPERIADGLLASTRELVAQTKA